MNLATALTLHAASPINPIQHNFRAEGRGLRCKLCGASVPHPRAAAAHLATDHKDLEAREFSDARRQKLAKKGQAMPGGGYPIVSREDLKNAVRAIGRAKNPGKTRQHYHLPRPGSRCY